MVLPSTTLDSILRHIPNLQNYKRDPSRRRRSTGKNLKQKSVKKHMKESERERKDTSTPQETKIKGEGTFSNKGKTRER